VIQQVDGRRVQTAAELRDALRDGDRPALVLVKRGEQHLYLPLGRRS
jgi:hypothetical protein